MSLFDSRWIAACLVAAGAASIGSAQPWRVTSVAGDCGYGLVDGPLAVARFREPTGLALDAQGNLYVTDAQNCVVRRISAAGVVSTVAGSAGVSGSADGSGGAAQFSWMGGIAAEPDGTVYVTERYGRTVRKISPGGEVRTLAGRANSFGSADGLGAAARFGELRGVAVDAARNVYVTDRGNHTLRKITPAGLVTTLAGLAGTAGYRDGAGTNARFNELGGVAVNAAGTVYVADRGNAVIRSVTPGGLVSTLAGSAGLTGLDDGLGSDARFSAPDALSIDGVGNLLVGDQASPSIRRVGADGRVKTLVSSFDPELFALVWDYSPVAVASAPDGSVYFADPYRHTIHRLDTKGVTTLLTGQLSAGYVDAVGSAARFRRPVGVAVGRDGVVYVADSDNHVIRRIALDGTVSTLAGKAGVSGSADGLAADARFYYPRGVAVDATGNVLVADSQNGTIRLISTAGVVSTLAGKAGVKVLLDGVGANARFQYPIAMAVDDAGNVYVADADRAVRKIRPGGLVSTLVTLPGGAGVGSVEGIAVGRAGSLYVTDTVRHVVYRISANGALTLLAGEPDVSGVVDGRGTSARFRYPAGLAVNATGQLLMVDGGTGMIRQISEEGAVLTLAGGGNGYVDGEGEAARFNYPSAIAAAPDGSWVIADTGNNMVRRVRQVVDTERLRSRLINLSILAELAAGESMTVGTVLGGAGTQGSKPVLFRAGGPSLATFGVSGVLADPQLALYVGQSRIGENDDWLGSDALTAAFAGVGAYAYVDRGSRDAALMAPALSAGGYTVVVSGKGGPGGVVIAELYDATPMEALSATTPRLINLSVLKEVGSGVTAGFVVLGEGSTTVLVRAVGPALRAFGVSSPLADPSIEVFRENGQSIALNDDWGGGASLEQAMRGVGAFELAADGKDSALLATLPAGSYTVRARGPAGAHGAVLVEVYEVR